MTDPVKKEQSFCAFCKRDIFEGFRLKKWIDNCNCGWCKECFGKVQLIEVHNWKCPSCGLNVDKRRPDPFFNEAPKKHAVMTFKNRVKILIHHQYADLCTKYSHETSSKMLKEVCSAGYKKVIEDDSFWNKFDCNSKIPAPSWMGRVFNDINTNYKLADNELVDQIASIPILQASKKRKRDETDKVNAPCDIIVLNDGPADENDDANDIDKNNQNNNVDVKKSIENDETF